MSRGGAVRGGVAAVTWVSRGGAVEWRGGGGKCGVFSFPHCFSARYKWMGNKTLRESIFDLVA